MNNRADTIREALRTVYDPCCTERGISIVDMGLLSDVVIEEDGACVELILTSGWCPFVLDLVTQVKAAIEALPEIGEADVKIAWDRAWSTDRLSASARRKLQFLPDPFAIPNRDKYVADLSSAPTYTSKE